MSVLMKVVVGVVCGIDEIPQSSSMLCVVCSDEIVGCVGLGCCVCGRRCEDIFWYMYNAYPFDHEYDTCDH